MAYFRHGAVLQQTTLPNPNYFGEGIVVVGNRLIELTWQYHTGIVYELSSFAVLGTFDYPGEGWGLTYDGTHLIMSDGTATLHFLDPMTFAEIGAIEVLDDTGPINNLNELEFINGHILANVWMTDKIAIIDPNTGVITGWIDLTGLRPPGARDVLNGVAYDFTSQRLFVTGKKWNSLFEIKLMPTSPFSVDLNPSKKGSPLP